MTTSNDIETNKTATEDNNQARIPDPLNDPAPVREFEDGKVYELTPEEMAEYTKNTEKKVITASIDFDKFIKASKLTIWLMAFTQSAKTGFKVKISILYGALVEIQKSLKSR